MMHLFCFIFLLDEYDFHISENAISDDSSRYEWNRNKDSLVRFYVESIDCWWHDVLVHGISSVLPDVKGVEFLLFVHSGEEMPIIQSNGASCGTSFLWCTYPGIGGLGATERNRNVFGQNKDHCAYRIRHNLYPVNYRQDGRVLVT